MIDAENLRRGAAKWEVELDATALSRFDAYAALLLEWNQKINLTAIKAPDEIVAKHFIDSLALLSFFSPGQDAKVIDVGTGAGFPGLALLIARPDLQLTLLDSTKKSCFFWSRCSPRWICGRKHCISARKKRGKILSTGSNLIWLPRELFPTCAI
mgnify:CR=1 FL=1